MTQLIPLATTHREQFLMIVRLHRLANEISDLIGGRITHPQRLVVGGFAKWPTFEEMEALRQKLDASMEDAEALGYLFKELVSGFPPFARETEYIALKGHGEYGLYDGNIVSTD